MIRRLALLAIILGLGACGPNIGELEKGEAGRVAEIVDGDTFILESGLRVTLTGIEAPFGDAPRAGEARAALERLTLGRQVQLGYGGLKRVPQRATPLRANEAKEETRPQEPARETALAQVFARSEGGRWIWVQQAMVAEGAAWVRTRRDNVARAQELLAAEARAREARAGLWKERGYRVRSAARIGEELETLPPNCRRRGAPFRIVEGRVSEVRESDRRVVLDFGAADDSFEVVVFGEAVSAWRAQGPAFESYRGAQVRVRGPMENRHGPHLCADHPEQIEVLSPA